MASKRNVYIEFLRFFATICVVLLHYEWIYIGYPVYFQHSYLFVEFFFVLSGFFLARNIGNRSNIQGPANDFFVLNHMLNTAKKLFTPYILAFVFAFGAHCLLSGINRFSQVLTLLWSSKFEVFVLHLTGFDNGSLVLNNVTAYIPAMLVAELAVCYLMCYHKKLFTNLVMPTAPIMIYAHILNTYGNLSQWTVFEGWFPVGILRGFAGVCLGCCSWYLSDLIIKKLDHIKLYLLTFTAVLGVLCMFILRDYISFTDQVIFPLVFTLLLACLYCYSSPKLPAFIQNGAVYLGKISYCIYLIHYTICRLMQIYLPNMSYANGMVVCIAASITVAIVLHHLSTLLDQLHSHK